MGRKKKVSSGETLVEEALKAAEVTSEELAVSSEPTKEIEEEPDQFDLLSKKMKDKWGSQVAVASDLPVEGVPRFSSGNFAIDVITNGGIPRGRIARFWGNPKSGKTGSALNCVASYQKHCSICASLAPCQCKGRRASFAVWVDVEGRLSDNMQWIQDHGIDLKRCQIIKPNTGEAAVDAIDASLRAGVGLVVLDSLAALTSINEIKKATEEGGTMAVNAKLINTALRRWQSAINSAGITSRKAPAVILLNQIRLNIGQTYGSNELQPGGEGQKFATSLDIRFANRGYYYMMNKGTVEDPDWNGELEKDVKAKLDGIQTPDYTQIECAVTMDSIGAHRRTQAFNYWLKSTHGHHPGDPDNVEQLFRHAKNYLLVKEGNKYNLLGLIATTQKAIEAQFVQSPELQNQAWKTLLEKFKTL